MIGCQHGPDVRECGFCRENWILASGFPMSFSAFAWPSNGFEAVSSDIAGDARSQYRKQKLGGG